METLIQNGSAASLIEAIEADSRAKLTPIEILDGKYYLRPADSMEGIANQQVALRVALDAVGNEGEGVPATDRDINQLRIFFDKSTTVKEMTGKARPTKQDVLVEISYRTAIGVIAYGMLRDENGDLVAKTGQELYDLGKTIMKNDALRKKVQAALESLGNEKSPEESDSLNGALEQPGIHLEAGS